MLPSVFSGSFRTCMKHNNKDFAHNACNNLVILTKLYNGRVSLLDPTEENNMKSVE